MHPSASAGVRLSAIVALAALVIFIVCPLGSIFITSFTGSENESLLVQHALDAALASENVETVVNSIVLAGLVVVLTTVMATPLALLLSRTSWGQSHWLDVALLIPFMTPPSVRWAGFFSCKSADCSNSFCRQQAQLRRHFSAWAGSFS